MGSFFDTSSKISVYSGSDKSKSFQMNGRTYCEGLACSSTGSATVNVDGIQFTVGLISYTYAIDSGSVLSVYKDNKLAQKINLSSTSEPIMVGVDTKDTDVVRLVMGASGRNSLGVVDVEMSEVDPAAFTTTFAATTSELYRCCL